MADSYDYEHLVTFEETNLVGNVYFANHVRWQGHCRERFLYEHVPAVLDEFERGLALVTVSCSVNYFSQLRAFDRVVIELRLDEVVQNRVSLRFDYRRVEPDGRALVARGAQQVACMRREGGELRAVPVPRALLKALEPFQSGRHDVSAW